MKRPQAEIDRAPLTDCSIDLLISKGVLNLCPDKLVVSGEVYRFLEPGGRFQMADMPLEPQVTPAELASKGSWSD
jgi:arsenite methyltransferase